MEESNKNLLTIDTFCVIKSNKTNKPYLDNNFNCYLFALIDDAKNFTEKNKDTYYENPMNLTERIFINTFYSYGIKNIYVKQAHKEPIKIPLENDPDTEKLFFNTNLNRNLLRLKQTGEKKYLRNIKDELVYLPINIEARNKAEYTNLKYSYSLFNKIKHFVIFSSIQEFDEWNNTQNNIFKPLKISFNNISRIRKKNSVIINPLSEKITLSDEQIKKTFSKS